jgi:hypothetical protein
LQATSRDTVPIVAVIRVNGFEKDAMAITSVVVLVPVIVGLLRIRITTSSYFVGTIRKWDQIYSQESSGPTWITRCETTGYYLSHDRYHRPRRGNLEVGGERIVSANQLDATFVELVSLVGVGCTDYLLL